MFNKQEDKISNDAPKQTNKKTRKNSKSSQRTHLKNLGKKQHVLYICRIILAKPKRVDE